MTTAGPGRGGSGSGSVAGANRKRSVWARAAVARTGSLQYDRGTMKVSISYCKV